MDNFITWLINRASRDTTSGNFIAEVDGLRFIAILSVVLFHIAGDIAASAGKAGVYDPLAALLSHGHYGVQLFFVISGFVIALPFAKCRLAGGKTPLLRNYYLRRVTRLEPPYFVNLILFYLMASIFGKRGYDSLLPHLLASMGYVHNYIYGTGSAINFVAWSLEVEIQFYILAPLITSIFNVKSKLFRRGALIGLIAIFGAMDFFIVLPYGFSVFVSALRYFLTGFILLDVYLIEWNEIPTKSYFWDVISIAAWSSICWLSFLGKYGGILMVIPIFFAYCAAFKGRLSNKFFNIPAVYIIGGMCYTIYLYHGMICGIIERIIPHSAYFKEIPLWASISMSIVVMVPIILLSCTLLFIYTEKPFMDKKWYLKLINIFVTS